MAPRLVNGHRAKKSARAQEDGSSSANRASTDSQSEASANPIRGARRPHGSSLSLSSKIDSEAPTESIAGTTKRRRASTSLALSIEVDSEAPTESTAGTAKRRRSSTTSLANLSATSASINGESSDDEPPQKKSKRPARPEIRAKPANKKKWVPPPHTGRSRVAFLDSGMLVMTPMPGQYKEPRWSEDQKALLKRLKIKSKEMNDEEVHKPYADLQHDGKFGPGVLKL